MDIQVFTNKTSEYIVTNSLKKSQSQDVLIKKHLFPSGFAGHDRKRYMPLKMKAAKPEKTPVDECLVSTDTLNYMRNAVLHKRATIHAQKMKLA